MARCLISFGANLGDAWSTIQSAAARVQELLCKPFLARAADSSLSAFQLSRCFRTPPVGGPAGQSPFVNAVAAVSTEASIWDVWNCIRTVEKEFGRERNLRWEARRIDLDILLYDDARIWTPHLKVPHPRMCMRRFILLPAVDVAKDWLDPVSGWKIGQLADNLRTGAGNFVLVADAASKPESLLAEVARRTGALWREPNSAFTSAIPSTSTIHSSVPANSSLLANPGRWVSAVIRPFAQINIGQIGALRAVERNELRVEAMQTKLVIALAPKVQATDVAWEDYHRALAMELGMRAGENEKASGSDRDRAGSFPWRGPRYLLASDDVDWAVQELIAALEAMDCPIEVA